MSAKAWCVILLVGLTLSVGTVRAQTTLSLIWDGTVAKLFWDQPSDIALTCIMRYYGAEYPSGRCWNDLPAGPQTDVWNSGDDNVLYRAFRGNVFVLCFSMHINGDFRCEPVASTALPGPDKFYSYLATIYGGPATEPVPDPAPAPPKYTQLLPVMRG